eukprot:1979625-Rhodomonas_salina.1
MPSPPCHGPASANNSPRASLTPPLCQASLQTRAPRRDPIAPLHLSHARTHNHPPAVPHILKRSLPRSHRPGKFSLQPSFHDNPDSALPAASGWEVQAPRPELPALWLGD